MMIMFAAIFTITMVMGALVVDVGLWLSERRSAVKAADLAALAGSQDLPASVSKARESALNWARLNGWDDSDPDVTVTVEFFCSNTLAQSPGICYKRGASNPDPERCPLTGEATDDDFCDSIRVAVHKPGTHIFSRFFGMGDIAEGAAAMAALSFGMVGTDVVLVIDKTGSMGPASGCTGTPCRTRIEWAQQAATALVDRIAGGSGSSTLGDNHVEVITFANGIASVVQSFSSSATAVRNAINGISNPAGDTAIAPALTQATKDLNAHTHNDSYRVVVLLSDGRNYVNGDPTSGTICNATHTRRAKTVNAIPGLHAAADTVYTVGVGDQTGTWDSCNPWELDTALLEDIAEGPPGDYTQVIDASTLPAVFQAIAWKIGGRALTQ